MLAGATGDVGRSRGCSSPVVRACVHPRRKEPITMSRLARSLAIAGLLLSVATGKAQADTDFNVTIEDPGGAFSAFYEQISLHTIAAGEAWDSVLSGGGSLEVLVHLADDVPTAAGGSTRTAFIRNNGFLDIYEQGAANEIRTGSDPFELEPDIQLFVGTGFLTADLWFDPNPTERLSPVPLDKVDAFSVFLHELGHAFAFNGFRNPTDGSLPGSFASTFDEFVVFDGANLFFAGRQAVDLYGGPVPLTFGNYQHFGNRDPRPGSDLVPDLMNGVTFERGRRYDISALDLALVADVGLPLTIPIPEPSTWALCGAGLLLMCAHQAARRRRAACTEAGAAPVAA
jgi:hypothetical protein